MANEGSTKPTYSELERYKEAAEHVDAIQARTIRELRAELLRVRGLLQRAIPIIQFADEHGSGSEDPQSEAKLWIAEAGAESADIGKLDRVDEKADV